MNRIRATTRAFNSVINRLSSHGGHREILSTFASMLGGGIPPDSYTFPGLLKACTSLNLFSLGISLHQRIIILGFSLDSYISSSLINFYAKFSRVSSACKVFDKMPVRDVVSWTSVISCYSNVGEIGAAFCMYNEMRMQGVEPGPVTLLGLISGVSELVCVQSIHGCVILYGFGSDLALLNSLLNVYGKCGSVEDARCLFEEMDQRDLVSWNSLISGYTQIGNAKEILQLLHAMKIENIEPDQQAFGSLLSATAAETNIDLGRAVHAMIVRAGFDLDARVVTSLVVMYLRCGNSDSAFRIFEGMPEKDVVIWTAMISGLVKYDSAEKALEIVSDMLKSRVEPSTTTITSSLAACGQVSSFRLGASIHAYILRRRMVIDIAVENSLVSMYAKCGHLEQSFNTFKRMEKRDFVSWNAIIAGYAQNDDLSKASILFSEMRMALQKPDSLTIGTLLQACASIGALNQGKCLHNFAIRNCLRPCIIVDTALVDMYCKCGNLDDAKKCFDAMTHSDLISWSTIIAGYGSNGKGDIALSIYSEFLKSGREPNKVIFLSLLSACSHNGIVNEGLSIFHSMSRDFGIEPELEHCACVVDLLCRARRVEEAYDFYKAYFAEPRLEVLGMLLDSCRATGNVQLGDVIAQDVAMLKPMNPGSYVQLARCYASMSKWDGVGEARTQMRSLGVKKVPGWSFIEVSGEISTFYMGHLAHVQHEEIVGALVSLNWVMINEGKLKHLIHVYGFIYN